MGVSDDQDLNDLAYFAWVVEAGGFAPAGRRHGLPKSKLSRRIKALEERLGVRLLQRSTRRFSVTSIGEVYYRHCKAVLREAEAAQESIETRHGEPCGSVRLTCPVTLLHYALGPMLAEFMQAYPRVRLDVEASNRRADLIGEGIDLALRVRTPPLEDSNLVMRKLGDSPQCLVATPALLDRLGRPDAPQALAALPSLSTRTAAAHYTWQLVGPGGASELVRHDPRLVTDDMRLLRQAALGGLGVVQLPTLAIHDQIDSGSLERVLPAWAPPCGVVHAVFASRRGMLPAVRQLLDFLAERYPKLANR